MSYFRIIMPNYNNANLLEKSIGSVLDQSFQDFDFYFIDDMSTDGSFEKACEMLPCRRSVEIDGEYYLRQAFRNQEKRWNGGSRNVAIKWGLSAPSEYTLFLDSDDWLHDRGTLQGLHDFIENYDKPDCVRLAYEAEYAGDKRLSVVISGNTPEQLCNSPYVACWTKCVKSELVQPFPENTLMEDVVQHLAQADVIKDVAVYAVPVVVYNRNNPNSCSAVQNMSAQNYKMQTSMYRWVADLLDLQLNHDFCRKKRNDYVKMVLSDIKKDKYIQEI